MPTTWVVTTPSYVVQTVVPKQAKAGSYSLQRPASGPRTFTVN